MQPISYHLTEFHVTTDAGSLTCLLHTPDQEQRAPEPALLLTFAGSARAAFAEPPQEIPARTFAAAGHYVVSFDLPHHGARVGEHGEGIAGFCRAWQAGVDPFARFVADGKAVIDACQAWGLGRNGKIVACGVSRAAYCALRLAAADPRILAVAALAPVTDWRHLHEFAAFKGEPATAALALDHWVDRLVDRAIYLAIGNRDERVGTDSCMRLAQRLFEAEQSMAGIQARQALHVVDSPGHTLADEWRLAGAQFLLQAVNPNV